MTSEWSSITLFITIRPPSSTARNTSRPKYSKSIAVKSAANQWRDHQWRIDSADESRKTYTAGRMREVSSVPISHSIIDCRRWQKWRDIIAFRNFELPRELPITPPPWDVQLSTRIKRVSREARVAQGSHAPSTRLSSKGKYTSSLRHDHSGPLPISKRKCEEAEEKAKFWDHFPRPLLSLLWLLLPWSLLLVLLLSLS